MSSQKDLQTIYDQISQEFSASRVFPWEELQVFIPYIKDNFKILDLGCGNGRLLKSLADIDKKYDYLGVDFSDKLIKQAQVDFPEYKFQTADMKQLNLSAESLDMVFMIASFHHIESSRARMEMLRKINTWLKPGGLLFMTNWNLLQRKYVKFFFKNIWHKRAWNDAFIPWQKYSDDEKKLWRYYHSFTQAELRGLLQTAGFKLEPLGVYPTKWNTNAFVQKKA